MFVTCAALFFAMREMKRRSERAGGKVLPFFVGGRLTDERERASELEKSTNPT